MRRRKRREGRKRKRKRKRKGRMREEEGGEEDDKRRGGNIPITDGLGEESAVDINSDRDELAWIGSPNEGK